MFSDVTRHDVYISNAKISYRFKIFKEKEKWYPVNLANGNRLFFASFYDS